MNVKFRLQKFAGNLWSFDESFHPYNIIKIQPHDNGSKHLVDY